MNLRDLEYFVALAKHGHFTRAAEACHTSQSTLSLQLKKLEEFLGNPLFERAGKKPILTAFGAQLLVHAQSMLREAHTIKTLAQSARDPLAGDCHLGAFPTLAPYLFPRMMPELRHALPKLRFQLVEEKTEHLVAQLKSASLDAALIADGAPSTDIHFLPCFEEEFLIAAPSTLAKTWPKKLTSDILKQHPLLLLDEGHCLRDQALSICTSMGAEESTYRATSLETLREMVAGGSGMTLMPSLAVPETSTRNIRYMPLQGRPFFRMIGLCYRASDTRTALFNALATHIRASVRGLPYLRAYPSR